MATTFFDVLAERPGTGRATAVGAALVERGLTGRRVLVMLPTSADYVTALLGCLYAGVIAVPVPPGRRAAEIAVDADVAAVLTADDLPALVGTTRERPHVEPDSLALVQYAPTGPPRGVMFSHANLIAAATQVARHLGMRHDTPVVSYLPPHQGLGLVGGVLAPLLAGAGTALVPPSASPDDWLWTVARQRARITLGPELAYAWRFDREYDTLSHLRVAVSGAGARTLDRFADRMARHGFSRDALFPASWVNDAAGLVTGRAGYATAAFDPDSLEPGRTARPGDRVLVDRGQPVPDLDAVVVDPLTATRCPDGTVGELWVSGPNVAVGYLGRPEASERTFCARLRGSTENYLRTGVLGVYHRGGLHLAERQDVLLAR